MIFTSESGNGIVNEKWTLGNCFSTNRGMNTYVRLEIWMHILHVHVQNLTVSKAEKSYGESWVNFFSSLSDLHLLTPWRLYSTTVLTPGVLSLSHNCIKIVILIITHLPFKAVKDVRTDGQTLRKYIWIFHISLQTANLQHVIVY